MPLPEPELNPHVQCPVCRFPPVWGGMCCWVYRAGDYLPPLDLYSQWKGFPLSQHSLTFSGNAFPSVLAHELVCQLPSPCSVGVLHEKRGSQKRAQINGLHMSLYVSCLWMRHLWKSIRIMHPTDAAASARESFPFDSPALPRQWAGYANPGPQPLPSPSVSRVLGRGG